MNKKMIVHCNANADYKLFQVAYMQMKQNGGVVIEITYDKSQGEKSPFEPGKNYELTISESAEEEIPEATPVSDLAVEKTAAAAE